jgi:hypothetical protein
MGLGGESSLSVTPKVPPPRYFLLSYHSLLKPTLVIFLSTYSYIQVYPEPIKSFKANKAPEKVFTVPVMAQGRKALEDIDKKMGLAFDDQVRA